MDESISQARLDVLRKCVCKPQQAVGFAPGPWFESAALYGGDWARSVKSLPREKVTRAAVSEAVHRRVVSLEEACVTIFAWGGMNRKHGAAALSDIGKWRDILLDLKKQRSTAAQAYRQFADLRLNGLKGMGPAYFTKLIYFFTSDHASRSRGFIMDQWTGLSVNFLSDRPIVLLSKYRTKSGVAHRVSDDNTEKNYLNFCALIHEIADAAAVGPDRAEEMIFSEGRGKGEWRNKLKAALSKIPH